MDYGLNAPAWLLSETIPFVFPARAQSCCGFIKSEKDWEYLVFVVLMWYLIGMQLDKRRTRQEIDKPAGRIWLSRVLRGLCGLYGTFLGYSAVEFYLDLGGPDYPCFLVVSAALWGAALILASVYPFSPVRRKTWYRVLGAFIATAGVFYCEAAVHLYRFRASFGVSTVAMLAIWGAATIVGGFYLLKLSGRPPKQTA